MSARYLCKGLAFGAAGSAQREADMKAVIESAGGVASQVRVGSHTLLFDQPSQVPGGEDRGPSPLDVLAATVGACAHYFAAAFLHARKLSPAGLRVEVEAEKVREPTPRLGKLSLHVTLPQHVPAHYLAQIERAVRGCPAYGTLLHSPEVELSFSQAVVESRRGATSRPYVAESGGTACGFPVAFGPTTLTGSATTLAWHLPHWKHEVWADAGDDRPRIERTAAVAGPR